MMYLKIWFWIISFEISIHLSGHFKLVIILGPPSNVFFQLELISWMVTPSSCLIWQIIGFILPPNKYGCVYAWTSGRLTYRRCRQKNHLFRWSLFWSWRICIQAKLSHLGHRKPARTHWKADKPKTSYCLVRIFVQRHNWAIFLWKWARRSRYSQWRLLSGHVARIFVYKILATGRRYVPHSRSFTRCFAPCFWTPHYQPQSICRLATSKLRFDTVELLFVGYH